LQQKSFTHNFSESPRPVKPVLDLQKSSLSIFAAFTIASSAVFSPPPVDAISPVLTSSSVVVAAKETREGMYGDYEIDVKPQQYDDARSTFKPASETKSNKGE
jgi:hypothetical protein